MVGFHVHATEHQLCCTLMNIWYGLKMCTSRPLCQSNFDNCKLLWRAFTVQKVKKFHKTIVFGIAFVFVMQASRSLHKQQRRRNPKIPVKG